MSRLKNILKQFPFAYPSRVIASCKDWIDQQNAQAGVYHGLRQHQYQLIEPAEQHTHDMPPLQDGRDAAKFSNNLFYSTPPAYLFCLKDSYLYKEMGLVLTNRNALFQEFTHNFGINSLKAFLCRNLFHTYSAKIKKMNGTGAVLLSPQSHNYYHWLSDVLPRVHLYESVMGHIDHFCVSALVPEKFLAVLPEFGIPMTKLLLVNDHEKLHFDTLYVASLPGSEGRSPRWAAEYVRKTLITSTQQVANDRKIYLKRGAATGRKILNEDGIIQLLQQQGFDIIDPDTLSIKEQIALMQQAKVIIAAHGAALANLIFAREGASVIELFSPDYFRTDCYFTLSNVLNLKHHYLKGEKPKNADWGDMEVDEAALTQLIDKING